MQHQHIHLSIPRGSKLLWRIIKSLSEEYMDPLDRTGPPKQCPKGKSTRPFFGALWRSRCTAYSKQHPNWVAVRELKLNHHNSDTMLFTMYPHYGNFQKKASFFSARPRAGRSSRSASRQFASRGIPAEPPELSGSFLVIPETTQVAIRAC